MKTIFQHLLLTGIEPIINHALQADANSDRLLKPLFGKTLSLRITNPDVVFSILFTRQSIHLINEWSVDADAGIHASAHDLLRKVLNSLQIYPQSTFRFDGDAQLIQAFWRLCTQYKPLWEQWLTPYLGPVAAYHIGQTGRRTVAWAQTVISRFTQSTVDYLQFDASWWVSRQEAELFFDAVDQLRLNAERLEMRLARAIKTLVFQSQSDIVKTQTLALENREPLSP